MNTRKWQTTIEYEYQWMKFVPGYCQMPLKIKPRFPRKYFIFNRITDSFLVEKLGTLEHARRYVCKNVLNLNCQDSICFAFLKLFKNAESFEKSFSFPFPAKYFDRKFKYFLLIFGHFLMSWSLKIQNSLNICFPVLSLTITSRGGICILKFCL